MFAAFLMEIDTVRLKENSALSEAIRAFASTGASELPVVGGEGVLIGTVGERALLHAVRGRKTVKKVEDLMEKDFASTGPETPLEEVMKLFSGTRESVFVLDNKKRLLGVITIKSLLRGRDG